MTSTSQNKQTNACIKHSSIEQRKITENIMLTHNIIVVNVIVWNGVASLSLIAHFISFESI